MKKSLVFIIGVPVLLGIGFLISKKSLNVSQSRIAVIADGGVALLSAAPEGWVLDKKNATDMGMCALYVHEGHNFETSPYLIYPRMAEGGEEKIKTTVQDMTALYKTHSQNFSTEDKDTYTTKNGLVFKVHYFMDGPPPRSFEAAAYLVMNNHLYISMYSAKNHDDFLKELKSFYTYLESVKPYEGAMNSEKCLYL